MNSSDPSDENLSAAPDLTPAGKKARKGLPTLALVVGAFLIGGAIFSVGAFAYNASVQTNATPITATPTPTPTPTTAAPSPEEVAKARALAAAPACNAFLAGFRTIMKEPAARPLGAPISAARELTTDTELRSALADFVTQLDAQASGSDAVKASINRCLALGGFTLKEFTAWKAETQKIADSQ